MIVKIRITDDALKYLGEYISSPDEATKEEIRDEISDIAQIFIGLCEKSETSGEEASIVGSLPGLCYRHRLRFTPSSQFNNNCPACYWESEFSKERKVSPEGERSQARMRRASIELVEFLEQSRETFLTWSPALTKRVEELRAAIEEGEEKSS